MKDLAEKASAFGIDLGYHDYRGEYRHSPASTIRGIIEVLESGDALERSPISLKPGDELPFQGGSILTEEGETLTAGTHLPEDFPFGYHSILPGGQRVPRRLIVSPGSCYLPENLHTWGWAAQLYSLRSARSWGMGDLRDLAALGYWSASKAGAGMILVNPLGAVTPGEHIQPSPYSPSSRCFRNPLYLGVESMSKGQPELEALSVEGKRLNGTDRIDREAVLRLKGRVLEFKFSQFHGDERYYEFCARPGRALDNFATFTAIAEAEGTPWPTWPERLQSPEASGIAEFVKQHAKRIAFHKWVQWLLDEQLAIAGRTIGLIQDLPVGIDPAGADAWMFRGAFAERFSVGAPPDDFNPAGQGWGIAPLHPRSLSGPGLDCFTQMLRSGFAHSMGLRIDHVMGLFRLFWIPEGGDPAEGTYVRYPVRQLLDALAIESHRAQSLVVGEDLGTVEPGVREILRERQILAYRLLLFEADPDNIPELSMAAITTHDLPTVAGIWSGADLDGQKIAGVEPQPGSLDRMKKALATAAGVTDSCDSAEEVTRGAYAALAASPAMLTCVTLEDALGVTERPNMPGTTDGWPNWSIPLPETLEELIADERVAKLAETVSEARNPD